MSANPMSVVRIVDDDEDVRNSLKFLLEAEGWKTQVYANSDEFLEKDNAMIPGCLILDIRMPGTSGLMLQNRLIEAEYALPIIFITAFAEVGTAVMALRRGALDFLTKPINDERLLESVETAVSNDWKRRSSIEHSKKAHELVSLLTVRELDVARLVAEGLSNKQIAVNLGIAETTVKVHRTSIYRKLEVKTPLEIFKLLER